MNPFAEIKNNVTAVDASLVTPDGEIAVWAVRNVISSS